MDQIYFVLYSFKTDMLHAVFINCAYNFQLLNLCKFDHFISVTETKWK